MYALCMSMYVLCMSCVCVYFLCMCVCPMYVSVCVSVCLCIFPIHVCDLYFQVVSLSCTASQPGLTLYTLRFRVAGMAAPQHNVDVLLFVDPGVIQASPGQLEDGVAVLDFGMVYATPAGAGWAICGQSDGQAGHPCRPLTFTVSSLVLCVNFLAAEFIVNSLALY